MPDRGHAGPMPAPTPQGDASVRLARDLTLTDATLLGVGALVGGGIFVLPGIAAGVAGPALFIALALNAIVTIPTLLAYAELASGIHDAGGGYLWVRDALGERLGFLGGWMSWFSHALACGVYALASASYVTWLIERYGSLPAGVDHDLMIKIVALAVTAFFVLLNYVGVKQAARAENFVTTIVLGTLAVFIGFGLLAIWRRPEGLGQLHLDAPAELFPNGSIGILLAMGLTFIAFEGYEIIAQASEEVKRPARNVPLASILSVAIVAPLLILVGIISVSAVQAPAGEEAWRWLASHKELALVEAASQFVPFGVGALLIVIGAMLSNVTGLNSTIYSSSRVSFAMGRDHVLPGFFARVHRRTQTPTASILFSGVLIAFMAGALPIQDVAAAADIMFLLLFTLVNVSYIKLRRTKKHVHFGFRAPLFPWLPLFGIVANITLAIALVGFSPIAAVAAVAWVGVGAGVHALTGRKLEPAAPPRSTLAFDVTTAQRKGYHIVLPVANPATVGPLASVARDIARAKQGSVTLLHVITIPRATLPSAARHLADPAKPLLREAARAFPPDVPVHGVIMIAHDPATAILETAEEEGADLVLMGWRGRPTLREHVLGSTLDPVVREAPCDVAVFRDGRGGEARRVVIAARGRGRHAKRGAELAAAIAKARDADLVAVTVITPLAHAEPEARLASVVADAGIHPWEVKFNTVRAPGAEAGLLAAAGPGDLLVLGASDEPAWRAHLFGTIPERVASRSEASVLLVKRQSPSMRLIARLARKGRAALEYLKPEA